MLLYSFFCWVQLQKCIGSATIAMGPEKLLDLLPISFNAEDLTFSNIWLIPILKDYVVGASLGFFIEHIVPLAVSFVAASQKGIYFFMNLIITHSIFYWNCVIL